MDNQELALSLCKRKDAMKQGRAVLDSHCQEIAKRVLPRQAEFLHTPTAGEKRTELVYDFTGALALERYAAAMESMLTPRISMWHNLKPSDPDLAKIRSVKLFFEDLNKRLFSHRYSPKANFASQQAECYMSLGAFGTAPKFIDARGGRAGGLRYKCLHLSRFFRASDFEGKLDTVFYEMPPMTYRQAAQQFGVENLPLDVATALKSGDLDKTMDVFHCVMPNTDFNPMRMDFRGRKFISYYVASKEKHILHVGGYDSMPYVAPRASVAPTEEYGRSPAMMVLPGLKMLNEMKKVNIRAAHLAVRPPLLTADSQILRPDTRPGRFNKGGLNAQGNELVKPMVTGSRPDMGEQLMEVEREVVNEAFFVTLFQILVDNHTMTATEVMERAREKAALIAPAMARQQSEDIEPMVEREISLLAAQGKIPEPPPELLEARGEYEVEHSSPLSRSMRSEEAVGLFRTLEGLTGFAQIDPSILDIFNPDEIGRGIADINGVPESWLRSRDEVNQLHEAQAQQAQMQQLLDAAPVVTQAQKSAAEVKKLEAQQVV